jgi:hypothetical protein
MVLLRLALSGIAAMPGTAASWSFSILLYRLCAAHSSLPGPLVP